MGLSVFFPFPRSVQFLLPILFIAALPTSVCWPSCLSCLSVFQWLHLCCPFVSLSVWLLICLSFWSLACCPNCTYFCVLSLGCPACLSTCLGILSVCLLIYSCLFASLSPASIFLLQWYSPSYLSCLFLSCLSVVAAHFDCLSFNNSNYAVC